MGTNPILVGVGDGTFHADSILLPISTQVRNLPRTSPFSDPL